MADPKAVVESWLDAMEQRDVDGMLDLLADDVSVQAESLEVPMVGKGLLRSSLQSFLDACESIEIEPKKVIAEGREVAVLAGTKAKLRADVEVLGERLPTAGKEVRALVALFVTVNERDEIAGVARVRDTWAVMRQLGVSPERMQAIARKVERELAAARPS